MSPFMPTMSAQRTRLRDDRVWLWCLRAGPDLADALGAAYLARHPTLSLALGGKDDNVVVKDERAAVDAIYGELFPGQHDQPQSTWSSMTNPDVKEHVLQLLIERAETNASATELFTVLAMKHASKGEGAVARAALERFRRPPLVRPSFSLIVRLVGENSPMLFEWALWLYTGQTIPAGYLLPDELAEVAYAIVKHDRPAFLTVLFLGLPLRLDDEATTDIYGHVLHVLLPLALIKARAVGWDACNVLDWIRELGPRLDSLKLFVPIHHHDVYALPVRALNISSRDWLLAAGPNTFATWYSYPLGEDGGLLRLVAENERRDVGIPVHGLEWLRVRGFLDHDLLRPAGALLTQDFLTAVVVDSLDKARYVLDTLQVNRDGIADYATSPAFAAMSRVSVSVPASLHVAILFTLIPLSVENVTRLLWQFVAVAISVENFDAHVAEAMAHYLEFPSLVQRVMDPKFDVKDVPITTVVNLCQSWARGLQRISEEDVHGMLILLRVFIPAFHDLPLVVLIRNFRYPWADGELASFLRELHKDRHLPPLNWPDIWNELRQRMLPHATETARRFAQGQ